MTVRRCSDELLGRLPALRSWRKDQSRLRLRIGKEKYGSGGHQLQRVWRRKNCSGGALPVAKKWRRKWGVAALIEEEPGRGSRHWRARRASGARQ
jgi:hypothetical protein